MGKILKKKSIKTLQRALQKKKAGKKSSRNLLPPLLVPPLSEMDAPEGYRAVSISTAMMEYAKPVVEFVEEGVIEDLNEALQIASSIWNYSNDLERSDNKANLEELELEITEVLKLGKKEARQFVNMMVERKSDLLPSAIQPDNPRTMFIKKEKVYLIPEFNYNSLTFSDTVIPPDSEDEALIEMIRKLDKFIDEGVEPDIWEKFYFQLVDLCTARFGNWMQEKKIEKYVDDFPFFIEMYMSFIYRYTHDHDLTLKKTFTIYFEEFLLDHVLRKASLEPNEYILCPPALKTFYRFLFEKGYLSNSKKFIQSIHTIEPDFIRVLRERYS